MFLKPDYKLQNIYEIDLEELKNSGKKRQHFKRYRKNVIFEKTIIVIISRT